MKVGDLIRWPGFTKVGIIWRIGSPNPIARIVWADGSMSAIHIKFLEVVCK
tara:strand:+ start:331 stop:483 length:153 start_codon:yes stop_codon:yes gene_type:complete